MVRTEGWEYLKNIYFESCLEDISRTLNTSRDSVDINRAQGEMKFYVRMLNAIKEGLSFKEEKKDVEEN